MSLSKPDLVLSESLVPRLLAWFATSARDLPWRRTENPYGIWISEIMLQQTQVATVIPYWERWMRQLPTVADLAKAKIDTVLKLWEGLGYYRRARNLHQAASQILEQHGGQFPRDFAAILDLPGVGPYTAGAVASIAFNQAAPILDGNVMRVLSRIYAVAGDLTEKSNNALLWRLARQLVEQAQQTNQPVGQSCSALNQALMELGALVCTPSTPHCVDCPAQKLCRAHRDQKVDQFPQPKKRATSTARFFATLVLKKKGRWFLCQRPEDTVNGGFWEFPSLELENSVHAEQALVRWLGLENVQLERLGQIAHAITRYRIRQEVFLHEPGRTPPRLSTAGQWVTSRALQELPLTGSHRRIVTELLA
ncbi:MAG TPA: A/G-specific adenine glycosylase [Candidatus Limnocylindria bacterium]|nr:A/G-specific adenine glycosylase [Candidatus Limnocylindria bacterium]